MIYRESLPQDVDISDRLRLPEHQLNIMQMCREMRQEAVYELRFNKIHIDVRPSGTKTASHIFFPSRLIPLFESAAEAVDRLPTSFCSQSKAITIDAALNAVTGLAANIPRQYAHREAEWQELKKFLVDIVRTAYPRKLTIAFSCKYFEVPYVNIMVKSECSTFPEENRVHDTFHVEVPARDLQAAKAALATAVQQQQAVIATHQSHPVCSLRRDQVAILAALANAAQMMEVFLERLFEKKRRTNVWLEEDVTSRS